MRQIGADSQPGPRNGILPKKVIPARTRSIGASCWRLHQLERPESLIRKVD